MFFICLPMLSSNTHCFSADLNEFQDKQMRDNHLVSVFRQPSRQVGVKQISYKQGLPCSHPNQGLGYNLGEIGCHLQDHHSAKEGDRASKNTIKHSNNF